ncbi:hypothetical protein SJAV_09150 [Sulfurisphaera javensis]|uniref:PIN domain-containing protein n=1 Tax=Sulfurisphaera javensis TaxID=2049879 RepID=A0AAT9GQ94_9CREN
MTKAVFVDTNILIFWLFELDNISYKQVNNLIECVNKKGEKPKILEKTVTELNMIISDAFLMTSKILINNLRVDWDSLTISERKKLLDEIERDYDKKYDDAYNKLNVELKNFIPRGGVRVLVSKKLFKAIYKEIINKTYKEIQEYLNPKELNNLLTAIQVFRIRPFFEIIELSKTFLSNISVDEITIIYEGIFKAMRNVKKNS